MFCSISADAASQFLFVLWCVFFSLQHAAYVHLCVHLTVVAKGFNLMKPVATFYCMLDRSSEQ